MADEHTLRIARRYAGDLADAILPLLSEPAALAEELRPFGNLPLGAALRTIAERRAGPAPVPFDEEAKLEALAYFWISVGSTVRGLGLRPEMRAGEAFE